MSAPRQRTLRRRPAGGRAIGIGGTLVVILQGVFTGALAQTRLAVLDEPTSLAVGVAVVIGAGSAWEMRRETGLTYLAARSVIEELGPELAPYGGHAAVDCDRSGITFTLSLPADTWEAGTARFLRAIFERPPGPRAVERARHAIIRELTLTEESLSTEIRAALARAEYGTNDRWARPPCGTASSIASLSAADVRRMSATRFTPYRATAAIAGPVGDQAARALLGRFIPDSELPLLVPAPTTEVSARAWRIERNTITTWIALGFPFERGADLEALQLLAFAIEREVGPAPNRPEIYDASVEIVQHGGGGTLMVFLATVPEQADRWVARVRSLVSELAESELERPSFEALRRRYAGHRLLGLESPEARARDAAMQLFFEERYSPAVERIASLSPASISAAAQALGAPAIVTLGPR